MMKKTALTLLVGIALNCQVTHAAVIFDWAYIGNAGNAPDTPPTIDLGGGISFPTRDPHGAVAYDYRISKHEVTNAQYTEFLNAVDPEGTNALDLYDDEMASHGNGGILFDGGAADGSKYQVKQGRSNNPVVFVTFFDAMRFTNWLENGQGSGDTEAGVYTIGSGTDEVRNSNASYFLPTVDEWFKAAYHKNDGVTGNYWGYATSTDDQPYSDQPSGGDAPDPSNVANYNFDDIDDLNGYNDGYAVTGSPILADGQNYLTDVGAYSSATSPYGTFDQTGNVSEWTETVAGIGGNARDTRGGSWSGNLMRISTDIDYGTTPGSSGSLVGFRVASVVPEPASLVMGVLAMMAVALWRR